MKRRSSLQIEANRTQKSEDGQLKTDRIFTLYSNNSSYDLSLVKTGVFEFVDSLKASEESILVARQKEKTKIAKENRREIGLEYDSNVTSDSLLCQKIIETNAYNPTFENIIDFSDDLSRIIATSQTTDSRNAGTVIGMTIFGAVGFLALSFTIVGALAGGLIGVGMGRYAGRKLTKRMRRKKSFTNEELFIIKLQCLIKMGKIQQTEMKHNLNKFRIHLEKILQEFTFVFDLSIFEKPKRVSAVLMKLHNFLLNSTNQKAILLSYKLLKNYLKLVQNRQQEIENEIASKVYLVFVPFKKALEFNSKNEKRIKKLTTYIKINALIERPEIQEILKRIPNPYTTTDFLQKFKMMLKEPVDIEEKIGQVLKWDRKKVQEALSNIEENLAPNHLNLPNSNTATAIRDPIKSKEEPLLQFNFKKESQKVKEELFINTHSKVVEDDTDEGVFVALKRQPVNIVKFDSTRFKMRNLPPELLERGALTERPTSPIKSSSSNPHGGSGLVHRPHHNNRLHHHNLPHPNLRDALLKENGVNALEAESSDDSSNDEGENEEEQKHMMEDSYLFLKSLTKRRLEQPFNSNHQDLNLAKTQSNKQIEEQKVVTNNFKSNLETRGGNVSLKSNKEANYFSQYHQRQGPSSEKLESQMIKVNSNPDIGEPELEHISKESFTQDPKPATNLKKNIDLELPNNQNAEIAIDSKKPETKAESFRKRVDTKQEIIFEKLLSIIADTHSKWDVIKNDKDLKVFKIKPENSDVVLIKAWAYINDVTPKQIFNCIYDTNIRSKWDTVLHNPHVIEKIDETFDIFYFGVKAPFPVSNRDFVQRRSYRYDYPEKGDIIISFQSTTHPKAPRITGTVRGETHVAGYIMKPAKNGKDAELHVITQVDVKGAIPKVVVNFVAGRAPAEWLQKLKKACHTLCK